MHKKNSMALATVMFLAGALAACQTVEINPQPAVPATQAAVFPGKGLLEHPFLYTGEYDFRQERPQTIWLVQDGKLTWSYTIPFKDKDGTLEELGDATRLSNGNIVFCRKIGASEITPDKRIIWNVDAQKNTEIHSVQPIGLEHVLMTIQAVPMMKVQLINTTTGKVERELALPMPHPANSPHLETRRVHQTAAGTLLMGHLDDNKVSEYDWDGKEIWSVAAPGPWGVVRLKNGNTLIGCSTHGVREVNPAGEIVWQFTQEDSPQIKLYIIQEVQRLANGDTVLCNWIPSNVKDPKNWPGTVQVLEVTPDKKIVWALSQWTNPMDFGPASSIQLLDEPGIPENGDLQR